MKPLIIVVSCAVLVASCSRSVRSAGSETRREADLCFRDRLAARVMKGIAGYADVVDIPGISMGVVAGDSLVYSASTGYADKSTHRLANPHTPYNIASVSKVFAATLAMMLADKGTLDLDAPVSRFYLIPSAFLSIPQVGL